jgi:hypothetical protein
MVGSVFGLDEMNEEVVLVGKKVGFKLAPFVVAVIAVVTTVAGPIPQSTNVNDSA